MTPEEKALLEETHELATENNKILRSMRRSARFDRLMKVAYWIIIIGFTVAAYYALQSYTATLKNAFGGAKESAGQYSDLVNVLKDL